MASMSNGDLPTAPTPLTGPPTSPAPALGAPGATGPATASPFPAAPPTAMPLAPPTAPSGFPVTPPAYTGPLPGGVGGGGWGPGSQPGPAPRPEGGRPGPGRKIAVGLLLVLALLAGVAGGFGLSRLSQSDDTATPQPRQVPELPSNGSPFGTDPTQVPDPGQGGQGTPDRSAETSDVDAVAQKVLPGVVNIDVLTAQGQGAGTGITLSSDGLVVTNNHVVRGATRIVVTDADTGERYEAEVVGTAKTKDLAVIQLRDAKGLDTVDIGDSDTVEVGDAVVALGNAGGQGGAPSVVSGNVTALGRSITASDESGSQAQRLNNLIQIDANIVPGDSGGPLANADGEVIGINAAASATNEMSSNDEGYAIPMNDAMEIVEQIKAGKESDVVRIGARGVLGVSVASVADPFGQGGGAAAGGASVAAVAEGSGAAEAGVVQGSTITAVDGEQIDSAEALTAALEGAEPGDQVKLSWTDPNGQSRTATVTLTEGPPD